MAWPHCDVTMYITSNVITHCDVIRERILWLHISKTEWIRTAFE